MCGLFPNNKWAEKSTKKWNVFGISLYKEVQASHSEAPASPLVVYLKDQFFESLSSHSVLIVFYYYISKLIIYIYTY